MDSLGRSGLGRLGVSEFLEVGFVHVASLCSGGDCCNDSFIGELKCLGGLVLRGGAVFDAVGCGRVGLRGAIRGMELRTLGEQ